MSKRALWPRIKLRDGLYTPNWQGREGSAKMSRGMFEAVFTTIMVLVLFAMFLAGIGANAP
jgi:hypothetical protein